MKSGRYGWLAIVAFVCAWDWFCEDTLSDAFDRAAHKHRTIVVALWVVLTLHLFQLLPKRYDPIHQVGRVRKR